MTDNRLATSDKVGVCASAGNLRPYEWSRGCAATAVSKSNATGTP